MDVKKIINKKLSGSPLTSAELEFIIMSYVDNTINDSIMTDFLKSVHQNGMVKDEIVSLTRIMINSGETIDFSDLKSFVADKHSTGGVGDKVSIILGPIMASLGIAVPMLAGRSLGQTSNQTKFDNIMRMLFLSAVYGLRRQVRVCQIGRAPNRGK